MGGHGGLNILPQKRWNVYNFDNREKVRKDEEEAAREEQLKREQSRKRDFEIRLEQLRRSRGLDPAAVSTAPAPEESKLESVVPKLESDSKHINLFDGIKIFDPIFEVKKERDDEGNKKKKRKKEEERVVGPEDEKYRLGYGLAGKGVKAPWYMMKPEKEEEDVERENGGEREAKSGGNNNNNNKKKTVEELREERLKREKAEKERERALLLGKGWIDRGNSGDRGHYYRR